RSSSPTSPPAMAGWSRASSALPWRGKWVNVCRAPRSPTDERGAFLTTRFGVGRAAAMCPRLVLPLLLLTVAVPCRALDVRVSAFSQLGEGEELHGGTLIVSVPFERWAAGSRASVASRAHPTE